ncbi:MAG: MmgE/PrpD family protein [Georgfuchsia sp.]
MGTVSELVKPGINPPVAAIGKSRTTARLAQFIAETRYEDIPAEVIHATKRMILDEIIVAAAAFDTPMGKALLQLKASLGGMPEATVVVDGRKLPAQSAAYINAQLANLLDADETMLNRMHTVSASVMTALALAERAGANGKDLIAAIATGYDISARVGMSLRQFVPDGKGGQVFSRLYGFSWMTFGAAATAGRLLGLDQAQMARTIGQAYATTPVYFDQMKNKQVLLSDGGRASWHKYQMSGAMAEAGINAAQLCSYGWIAQSDVLDEGSEFWLSFAAPGCDWNAMYGGLGEKWYIAESAIKPYPFCRFAHQSLDIFTKIVSDEKLAADEIEDVLLRIPPHQLSETLAKTRFADEGLKLMGSHPTALALIALGIPPGPKWFNADLSSERVRSFARKVRHEVNAEWGPLLAEQMEKEGVLRYIPTEVIVRTRSGAEYRGFAQSAHGDPWAAGFEMTDAELGDKARGYLDGILPAAKIDALITAVFDLDKASDVRAVAHAMSR